MSSTNRPGSPSPSPYELVFGSAFFEEDRFPGIREEAEARGVATESPERFLHLGTVGALLQELLPEDAEGEEFARHGVLLFQAYHFWLHGKESYRLEESEVRDLLALPSSAEEWHFDPPAPAGYLELPRHLIWARIEEGATPEPVEGFFWTRAEPIDPSPGQGGRLQILMPLGIFPGRPGFSTIALELIPELVRASAAGAAPGGEEREDFENILPGGELQGWFGLETELEVARLVSRVFGRLAGKEE